MYKATYKGKTREKFPSHGGHAVHLFYEYRGREYMVTDCHNGYSEDIATQHRNEQRRIDREIEEENKPAKEWTYEGSAEEGFDLFWSMVEGL